MRDCLRYEPTFEEIERIKWGDFSEVSEKNGNSLADRVQASQRRDNSRNNPAHMEENKRGEVLDFGGSFNTIGHKPKGRPPPGLGQRRERTMKPRVNNSKPVPKVKMNKAMEARIKANKDKTRGLNHSRTTNFDRERSTHKGKIELKF